VFFLAIFFRRYPNPLNSLAIAAVILLLIRPTNLFDAGWQLSFACVLGILMFCKRFYYFFNERLFTRVFWQKNKVFRFLQKFGQGILGLLTTGLAAWLGGAGILLYHFYTVDLLSSVWTVVAFPFVALILWLGFVKILLSFIPGVAILLGWMLNAVSWALIWIVELMSKLDFSHFIIGQVPLWVILLYYGGIAVIVWAWYLRPFTRKIVITATVLAMVGPVGFIKLHRMYPGDLQMTCLDVGHGQAVIVQSPGCTFLFDAGSLYKDNIGRWVVTPFLRSRGIGRLDAAVISHDDVDHFNGLVEIAKEHKIENVYTSQAFINKYDESETVRHLADCLKQQGIMLTKIGDIELSEKLKIKTVWPDAKAAADKSLTDNNKSVVNLIEFAGRKILLCADIEEYAQQKLLGKNENLNAEIVLVPHHGSIPNDGWKFLKSIAADYLICSSSISSYERLQRAKPDVDGQWFYTAKDGAISVRIRRDGKISVKSFKD
jgi:competence protein ComEC